MNFKRQPARQFKKGRAAIATCLVAMAIVIAPTDQASADLLSFTWSGEVGTDPNAQGIDGNAWGNTAWFHNGNQLAAGTELRFTYTIDNSAQDLLGNDPNVGRFDGGTLMASIPSLGINDLSTVEGYWLEFVDGTSFGVDAVRVRAEGNEGLAVGSRWDGNTDPWLDVNNLTLLQEPVPPPGDIISFFLNTGNGVMTLSNGDTISTSGPELLTNGSFYQVPEPSTAGIGIAALIGFACMRRRRTVRSK